MDSTIEIIKILSTNIAKNSKNLTEKFTKELKEYRKKPFINNLLNFEHIRTHSDYEIKLKNCEASHCIECLSDFPSRVCIHEQAITPYEETLIKILNKELPCIEEDNRILYGKCLNCNQKYFKKDFNKLCTCHECINCIALGYTIYKTYCIECRRFFEKDEILEIRENTIWNVQYTKICSMCGLGFEEEAFLGPVCFVCSDKGNFN
jgi:hypothetical protein